MMASVDQTREHDQVKTEIETRQYCALVKVWVWAEDAKHAEKVAEEEMHYLSKLDSPVAGFSVVEVNEDGEV